MSTPLFELAAISYGYGAKRVLDQLSLSLAAGQFYGLIGPNGCGKTTLVDLLIRHRQPLEGHLLYRGRPLQEYSQKTLGKEMALVPQNFYINFPYTAREVVLMGRYPHMARFSAPGEADNRIVDQTMRVTDTDRFADKLITQLSGGERQRVIFARALAQTAPVLILDEATSNLDVNHAVSLLGRARDFTRQQAGTVLSVMQDLNLAALFCDQLLFMHKGGVAIAGPVDDVLTAETLKTIFKVDAKVYFEPYINAPQVVYKSG
jgi:iron complex transport system ATP-binding protein